MTTTTVEPDLAFDDETQTWLDEEFEKTCKAYHAPGRPCANPARWLAYVRCTKCKRATQALLCDHHKELLITGDLACGSRPMCAKPQVLHVTLIEPLNP